MPCTGSAADLWRKKGRDAPREKSEAIGGHDGRSVSARTRTCFAGSMLTGARQIPQRPPSGAERRACSCNRYVNPTLAHSARLMNLERCRAAPAATMRVRCYRGAREDRRTAAASGWYWMHPVPSSLARAGFGLQEAGTAKNVRALEAERLHHRLVRGLSALCAQGCASPDLTHSSVKAGQARYNWPASRVTSRQIEHIISCSAPEIPRASSPAAPAEPACTDMACTAPVSVVALHRMHSENFYFPVFGGFAR